MGTHRSQENLALGEARQPPPKTLRALGTRPVGLRLSLPNGSDSAASSDKQWLIYVDISWSLFCLLHVHFDSKFIKLGT